jgi:hypothetical protein
MVVKGLSCNSVKLVLGTLPTMKGLRMEDYNSPAISALGVQLQRLISNLRSQKPVVGWVTKKILTRAPPCFGKHVMPLIDPGYICRR